MSLVETDPYSVFLFGMRSSKTREKVVPRLKMFFDFIGIQQAPMSERCRYFIEKWKENQNLIFTKLIQYVQYQKDRVEKKEISAGTLKNYYLAVKVFCEMNQIDLGWKRISRALPKVKRYADDKAPTLYHGDRCRWSQFQLLYYRCHKMFL